jgi:hypothetical protein
VEIRNSDGTSPTPRDATRFLLVFIFIAATFCIPKLKAYGEDRIQGSSRQRSSGASFVYEPLLAKLQSSTRVPLRLPSVLPGVDRMHPIYARLQSADESRYKILLSNVLPCEGQNNCLYGTVEGDTSPIDLGENAGSGNTVSLSRGIRGQYIPAICRAYCSQAYVTWTENGFHYAIGLKAERLQNLIKAANSAIL